MMHRQETVECLKKFNARRKLKVRGLVWKVWAQDSAYPPSTTLPLHRALLWDPPLSTVGPLPCPLWQHLVQHVPIPAPIWAFLCPSVGHSPFSLGVAVLLWCSTLLQALVPSQ